MIARVLRVTRSFAADPLMFPALRARVGAHRTPAQCLLELGFDAAAIADAQAGYATACADLYPRLAARWLELMGDGGAYAKLTVPQANANASNEVAYLSVRLTRPELVVETGTFGGILSSFILRALDDTGSGRLVSLDLPAYTPIPRAIDVALPAGHGPGFLIPDELRHRLELVEGDARTALTPLLARVGSPGVYVFDSLQTYRHMMFEFRSAAAALPPGGMLLANNAFVTPAFWHFTRKQRVPLLFVGGDFGVVRLAARSAR